MSGSSDDDDDTDFAITKEGIWDNDLSPEAVDVGGEGIWNKDLSDDQMVPCPPPPPLRQTSSTGKKKGKKKGQRNSSGTAGTSPKQTKKKSSSKSTTTSPEPPQPAQKRQALQASAAQSIKPAITTSPKRSTYAKRPVQMNVHFDETQDEVYKVVPRLSTFTEEQREQIWFNDEDFDLMYDEIERTAEKMEQGKTLKDKKYTPLGLEGWTMKGRTQRKWNKEDAWDAVLDEQYRNLKDHGRRISTNVSHAYQNASRLAKEKARNVAAGIHDDVERYMAKEDGSLRRLLSKDDSSLELLFKQAELEDQLLAEEQEEAEAAAAAEAILAEAEERRREAKGDDDDTLNKSKDEEKNPVTDMGEEAECGKRESVVDAPPLSTKSLPASLVSPITRKPIKKVKYVSPRKAPRRSSH